MLISADVENGIGVAWRASFYPERAVLSATCVTVVEGYQDGALAVGSGGTAQKGMLSGRSRQNSPVIRLSEHKVRSSSSPGSIRFVKITFSVSRTAVRTPQISSTPPRRLLTLASSRTRAY